MDKIFCLVSFGLYLFAPNHYSFLFCVLLLGVLLANAFYVFMKDCRIEILGFNTIFSLSIILVTFIYPLFIYQVLPSFSLFAISYNENVISKASAMVNIAYSMYVCGYMKILRSDIKNNLLTIRKEYQFPKLVTEQNLSLLNKIVITLFILIIVSGGLSMFQSQYGGDKSVHASVLFSLVWAIFHPLCILTVIANLYYKKIYTYTIIFVIMLIIMAVGSRTLPLCTIILVVYALCLKKNISIYKIATIGVTAFVLLSIVGRLRSGNTELSDVSSSEIGLLAYFEDFIVCTRNQYVIYDYVQTYGTTHGVSSLGYVLAVVPFAQSTAGKIFGWTDSEMRSESLTTKWGETDVGLGTHIVGDVYLAFGLSGVILLFYMLGYVVAKSRRNMLFGNHKGTIIYLVLLSGSMFMCRGSFFYSLKNIVWALIIISLLKGLIKRKSL